ncbi:glycosyltransferase [Butyrivibrio sp. AE2032]|uniref:glycosyltransferase n=1 Tax=Butyrivibrio sp. AE2032 TaxID=1458463 RepID=UPI0006913E99|nr:glycosyltransferase [Butyrivibrio sp. AE2032]
MKRDYYKVSVIVPIYNVEKQLKRCVDSILGQSYSNLEIILVDDGSPDNCGDICDQYAAQDCRIKVVHKENGGLGFARNSGLDIATGNYVVFIDSDDYITSDYVEKLLSRLVENNADLVLAGLTRERNGQKTDHPTTDTVKVIETQDIVDTVLLPIIGASPNYYTDVEREMSVCINMYCMDIISENQLRFVSEREYVSEDFFFNLNYLLKVKKAVLIPECIYIYSDNVTSLTNTYRSDRYDKYKKMMMAETDIIKSNNIYDIAVLRLYRTFIMKCKKCIALIALSDMPIKDQLRECRHILKDDLFVSVVNEYYRHVYQNKQKLFLFLMKNRMSMTLLLLYRIKNHG